MLRVVRPICCGVDVHKRVLVAPVAKCGEGGQVSYERGDFGTLRTDLLQLAAWLEGLGCPSVCMESTGKYWVPVYEALEGRFAVCVAPPKYVRAVQGRKTDPRDSARIADLNMHDLVRTSFIPPRWVRDCREIARYREKLVAARSSEKCRYQNSLTVSGIALDCVVADVFGKTARGVMEAVTAPAGPDEAAVRGAIVGRCRRNADRIVDAVMGAELSPAQAFKVRESLAHMAELDRLVAACEAELRGRMEPAWGLVRLLCGIPGVSEVSAMLILAEIGTDMDAFGDADHLCSWAGLVPACDESAGKRKSNRITKAGRHLKPVLVQCARAAVWSVDEPYFARKYERIKARRGAKKAIVAIARMMLTCMFHMIRDGTEFCPSDYEELRDPRPERPKLTEDSARELLESLGYTLTKG